MKLFLPITLCLLLLVGCSKANYGGTWQTTQKGKQAVMVLTDDGASNLTWGTFKMTNAWKVNDQDQLEFYDKAPIKESDKPRSTAVITDGKLIIDERGQKTTWERMK